MNIHEIIPAPTSVPRFSYDWGRIAAEVGRGRGRSEEWVRQHSVALGYLIAAGVVIVRHGALELGTTYPRTDAAEMMLCWSRDFLSKQAQQADAVSDSKPNGEIDTDALEDKFALTVRQHAPSPASPVDTDELERKLALTRREHAHVVDALKRQIVDLQAHNERLTAERALLSAPALDDPVALSPIEEQWPEVIAVAKNWQRKAVTAWCVAAAGWLGLIASAIGMIFW